MRLRKAVDNSLYEAKLGDRRIRAYVRPDEVTVRIKRTISSEKDARPKELQVRGKTTLTFDAICTHAVNKRTAELVFALSDEGAEALLAVLSNWYQDHIEKKESK